MKQADTHALINLSLLLDPVRDTFVDVGADGGVFSTTLARSENVWCQMKIVAFEPDGEAFERLKKSLAKWKNVDLHNLSPSEKENSLDSLKIPGYSIVMKINAAGNELPVLKGAQALFNANRIKAVYINSLPDASAPAFLLEQKFVLFDGKTLKPVKGKKYPTTLIAIQNIFYENYSANF